MCIDGYHQSPEDSISVDSAVWCFRTAFDTSACKWRISLSKEALKTHNTNAKKICVSSDSSDDEVEYEEKRVSVPSVHAAIEMFVELILFAQVTL